MNELQQVDIYLSISSPSLESHVFDQAPLARFGSPGEDEGDGFVFGHLSGVEPGPQNYTGISQEAWCLGTQF